MRLLSATPSAFMRGYVFASEALVSLVLAMTISTASVAAEVAPAASGGELVIRRLTPDQYRNTIAQVFGPTVKPGGRFEPDIRVNQLLSVGAAHVSVTPSGLQEYDLMARDVASQVVSEEHRKTLMPCVPASLTKPDDACARQFLSEVGLLLFRRPLSTNELDDRVAAASVATIKVGDFYSGLGSSLSTLLVSPNFLFRRNVSEPDPSLAGAHRLTAYSKAAELSSFLWNAAPDKALLSAAEKGDLNTDAGLARQVERMTASPRLEHGIRAFFSDMLGFDEFSTLAKDSQIFPKFTFQVVHDAQEQTLRSIVHQLMVKNGDYRDLFTMRDTFLTPRLASIYGVVLPQPDGNVAGWSAYQYPEGDPRSGLLAQASFVALHSHPGRSSPTLRGKALRELILCQPVPPPPGNVEFTVVQETGNPVFKTARARLNAHATEAMCKGCHKITDPMGLALESFDSSGSFRTKENGVEIDTSGELNGRAFKDSVGLGQAVRENAGTASCLVKRMYTYATGRAVAKGEEAWVKSLGERFSKEGYRVPALMRMIAANPATYRVAPKVELKAAANP